jgi:hypothetical protein
MIRSLSITACARLVLVGLICTTLLGTPSTAEAQTLTVLHTFIGEHNEDGAAPMHGVVLDRAGNLYGTTFNGGLHGAAGDVCFTFSDDGGCGTVFKLAKHGSSWIYSQLYKFEAAPDGNFPNGVVIAPDGSLYGTTYGGGFAGSDFCNNFFNGCGIAFRLQPQANVCPSLSCPWTETVLHTFTGMNGDGAIPGNGDLIFDHPGNVYGTTTMGGTAGFGTAYELTPSQGGWTENIFYTFDPSQQELGNPSGGLLMDQAGNFYGNSGYNIDGQPNGGVYQLVHTQSGWTANALQIFQCTGGLNGCFPDALLFDPSGNLIFATSSSGFHHLGTVDRLDASSGWSLDLLYTFQTGQGWTNDRLTMDAAGNLYGVASNCATGYGCIYKLTPSESGYSFTDLYDFTGGPDGESPSGPVAIDANGNLYGTAAFGGNLSRCLGEGVNGCGTVWKFTP